MSLQHILKNSSVSGKEPLASQLANGELSINYHADGPFLCCKDTAGNVRRVAGVWVSATAPSTPFPGELWLDTGISPSQLKVYKNATDTWVFAGEVNTATTTTEGVVRLATNAEAQGGTSTTSAVTPAALQSKISDSTSTTSSTTIASSAAVKAVADTVGAALPKSGGTITGILEIGNAGQLRFEGSSNDAYETTLAVEDPTATRTITLPDRSGTVITTGDTGTVTSTMIADGTIVNADINANAEIAVSKLADGSARQLLQTDAAGTGVEWTSNVNIPGTLDVTGATALDSTLSVPAGSAAAPSINFAGDNTGIYSPGEDQLALSTGGTARLFVDSTGNIGIGTTAPNDDLEIRDSVAAIRITDTDTNQHTRIVQDFDTTQIINTGAGSIRFSNNGFERIRLDSSGRLGLGTSSPGARLTIGGTPSSGVPGLDISDYNANVADTSDIVLSSNGVIRSSASINNVVNTSGYFAWKIGGSDDKAGIDGSSDVMRIDSSGNVGIGTGSPDASLHVNSAGNTIARISSSFNNSTITGLTIDTTGDSSTPRINFQKTGTTRGVIKYTHNATANDEQLSFNIAGGTDKLVITGAGTTTLTSATSTAPFIAKIGTSEVARIDGAGRLLVGTSSSLSLNSVTAGVQIHNTQTIDGASLSIARFANDSSGSQLLIGKSRNGTIAAGTIVQENDDLGNLFFNGDDGTDLNTPAARISVFVDGTPGVNDMPGRLVFGVTGDGGAGAAERLRITRDGVLAYRQSTPVAVNTTATLTVAYLKNGIITSTTAAAVTMTLPTGTDTEAGFSGMYNDMTFEWSVINTGATNAVTVSGNTGHTLTGSSTVAASTSGRFASRRTGSNTFVTYRLS